MSHEINSKGNKCPDVFILLRFREHHETAVLLQNEKTRVQDLLGTEVAWVKEVRWQTLLIMGKHTLAAEWSD